MQQIGDICRGYFPLARECALRSRPLNSGAYQIDKFISCYHSVRSYIRVSVTSIPHLSSLLEQQFFHGHNALINLILEQMHVDIVRDRGTGVTEVARNLLD